MSKVNAVIGANFGDEGKGLLTNFFAEVGKNDSIPHLTVRFNGGGQAGHTVIDPKTKQRHVFNHIGAGTFHGAETALDENFVVNPFIYRIERARFDMAFPDFEMPSMYVNYDCLVTTPYEILVNQTKEEHRRKSSQVHGSCGVGFGETAKKKHSHAQTAPFLSIANCFYRHRIKKILEEIRQYTFDVELKDLPLSYIDEFLFKEPMALMRFEDDLNFFMNNSIKIHNYAFMSLVQARAELSSVCFEGAQGLGLDMDRGYFPHVTYSNTGIKNLAKYFNNGIDIHVNYVTRSYLTRHGAGPMENSAVKFLPEVKDLTNIQNKFQGLFRVAPLDITCMKHRINKDLISLSHLGVQKPKHSVIMTHGQHLLSNDYIYTINGIPQYPPFEPKFYGEFAYILADEKTNPFLD